MKKSTSRAADEDAPLIDKPKGKYSIQAAMGLGDNRDEYKRIVVWGVLFTMVSPAEVGFLLLYRASFTTLFVSLILSTLILGAIKIQRLSAISIVRCVVSKAGRASSSDNAILLVLQAAKREPFLQRFRKHWATADLVQQYFQNARGYRNAKLNPNSGVMRRRARLTKVGAHEAASSQRTSAARDMDEDSDSSWSDDDGDVRQADVHHDDDEEQFDGPGGRAIDETPDKDLEAVGSEDESEGEDGNGGEEEVVDGGSYVGRPEEVFSDGVDD